MKKELFMSGCVVLGFIILTLRGMMPQLGNVAISIALVMIIGAILASVEIFKEEEIEDGIFVSLSGEVQTIAAIFIFAAIFASIFFPIVWLWVRISIMVLWSVFLVILFLGMMV